MRHTFAIAVCIVLSGCAAIIPPAIIEKPERLQPIKSQIENSKSIFVTNVVAKMIDKKVGQMKVGILCVGEEQLVWKDNIIVLSAIRDTVLDTLAKNGYNVYSGLIEASEKDADILIGVGVEDVKANLCYSVDGMKGEASLHLKFEIFDTKTRKSIFTKASGVSIISEFSRTGDPDVFIRAAEMATENVLAQEAFFSATRK